MELNGVQNLGPLITIHYFFMQGTTQIQMDGKDKNLLTFCLETFYKISCSW